MLMNSKQELSKFKSQIVEEPEKIPEVSKDDRPKYIDFRDGHVLHLLIDNNGTNISNKC